MKLIDLTGKKFGKLSVIKRDYKQKKAVYWLCRCDCGNEVSVDGRHLRNGDVSACKDCARKARKGARIDLKDKRFGKLTAVSFKDGKWHCICDCGNEKDVWTNELINGYIISCGCEANKPPHMLPHICKVCGIEFNGSPRASYCPDCRAEREKERRKRYRERAKSGKTRKIGQEYPCEMCGKMYILNSGIQRFCPDCAKIHYEEASKKLKRLWTERNKDENKRKRLERKNIMRQKNLKKIFGDNN